MQACTNQMHMYLLNLHNLYMHIQYITVTYSAMRLNGGTHCTVKNVYKDHLWATNLNTALIGECLQAFNLIQLFEHKFHTSYMYQLYYLSL